MTTADPRIRSLVPLDRATIESMCAPIAGGIALGAVATVDGGLVNTLLRVTAADGTDYALRVLSHDPHDAAGSARFAFEVELLRRLARILPVPSPLVVDPSGQQCGVPFLIYRWIDGITLNDCRRTFGAAALSSLAEPIGHLMASIAAVTDVADGVRLHRLVISDALHGAHRHLASALVHARLGTELAQALRERLVLDRGALEGLDDSPGLVHGDFSGRNVIVRGVAPDEWTVSGVLDWETASIGARLWDLGSLFRYTRRYDADFRRAFERGYRKAGQELPDEWWYLARLLNATRLIAILADERELPHVFDDCREILTDLAAVGRAR